MFDTLIVFLPDFLQKKVNFPCILRHLLSFFFFFFHKNSFTYTNRVSNDYVGSALGLNCLQRLSADEKS